MLAFLAPTALHLPWLCARASAAELSVPSTMSRLECRNEKLCLQQSGKAIRREGRRLIFRSPSGARLVFADAKNDCQPNDDDEVRCPTYRLRAFNPAAGLALVEEKSEPNSFHVVSVRLAKEIVSGPGEARFSPDGRTVASLFSSTEVAGQDVSIFSFEGNIAKREFDHTVDSFGENGPRTRFGIMEGWISNTEFKLRFDLAVEERQQTIGASVHQREGRWDFVFDPDGPRLKQ
ncbi:hypothetical protein GGD65_004216 [Bradyrhizobium sp. CIR18]|uniref:hypothetical protein n=1 Tax=Bradyrhizobium sp. CIR18 TaxID=2663839 RepID=UPI001605A627|nr:hypothetical protein [Bradyrhizobium sp. CIR18]MBB4363179.1 hypothetical protein [Bradyrhizobium sp. CIR18]